MEQYNLEELIEQATQVLKTVKDLPSLQQVRANYLGKKGLIASMMGNLKAMTIEQKKRMGNEIQSNQTGFGSLVRGKKKGH